MGGGEGATGFSPMSSAIHIQNWASYENKLPQNEFIWVMENINDCDMHKVNHKYINAVAASRTI
jgi:hypothetical protein